MSKSGSNLALGVLVLAVLTATMPLEASGAATASPAISHGQIEADWLRQEQVRAAPPISRDGKVAPEKAARFALTSDHSYQNLLAFADKDLEKLAFERDVSVVGDCVAGDSKLLALLTEQGGHEGVHLDADSLNRLITWMDVYAQKLGSFSPDQERQLYALRLKLSPMLAE